jgi:hypothetical protein
MASYIERRKFLATLGGAWPLAARAQQPERVVGILSVIDLERLSAFNRDRRP